MKTRAAQGTTIQHGDIVLIRFGWLRRYLTEASPQVRERPAKPSRSIPAWRCSHENTPGCGTIASSLVAANNVALECWPAALGRPFFTPAEREQGAGDPHSEIMRRTLIGLLGNADAVLHSTETQSGRIRGISVCSEASSRITTGQRDTWI